MTSIEIADKIKEILDNKKAVDINILKVKEKTVLADYFVVATGTSSVHVKSLADEVEVKMEELLLEAYRADIVYNFDEEEANLND